MGAHSKRAQRAAVAGEVFAVVTLPFMVGSLPQFRWC